MASLFSHPAVPLAIGVALGARVIPPRLLWIGIAGCRLPDADVLAFHLGVPYESAFAHRGFTHSIFFALLCAAAAAPFAQRLGSRPRIVFAFVAVATASHGLLDALTTGGSGIAFFWPFGHERYFLPLQVILVSPIGVSRFFQSTAYGCCCRNCKGCGCRASQWRYRFALCAALVSTNGGMPTRRHTNAVW